MNLLIYNDQLKILYLTISYYAALNGQLTILKWIKTKGYKMDKKVSINAATNGHIEIIKWIHNLELDIELDIGYSICDIALLNGHFEICRWGGKKIGILLLIIITV